MEKQITMSDFDSNVINAREMYALPKKLAPKVDEEISKIVGKQVLGRDPRLIGLIVKYQKKKDDPEVPDNFLKNPKFITELKEVFDSTL